MSNSNNYTLKINLISPRPSKDFIQRSSQNTAGSTNNYTEKRTHRYSEYAYSTFFNNSERNTITSKTSIHFPKNSVQLYNNIIDKDKKFYEIKKEFNKKSDLEIPTISRNKVNHKLSYSKDLERGKTLNVNFNKLKNLPFIMEDSNSNAKIFNDYEERKSERSKMNQNKVKTEKNEKTQRLTKKKLEEERKFLKEFFKKNFPEKLDFEKETYKESRYITNIDEKLTKRREYSLERDNFFRANRIKNEETIKFLKKIENPALGIDYIKSSYGKEILKLRTRFGDKNENRFKRFYTTKSIGSSLLAKRIGKETESKKYDNIIDNKYTQVSKLKLKWRTIKWILENKPEVVDRLLDLNLNFLNDPKSSPNTAGPRATNKGLSRQEFSRLLIGNKITSDLDLINKLFWVFDEDGDNELTYQEIAFGIEMFKNSPIEQKLKALFDLCDVDNSGTISKQEFFNLLRKNIINNDEKISMKQVVDKIFSCVKLNKNGEITFDKLKEGCEKNQEIHTIIYKNLLALKSIDNVIDKDIKSDLMKFNPELNIQLRMKLLSMRIAFYPLREEKFTRFLDNYVSNKQKRIESEFLRGIREDEDSFDGNDEEECNLFPEEKYFVKKLKESKSQL